MDNTAIKQPIKEEIKEAVKETPAHPSDGGKEEDKVTIIWKKAGNNEPLTSQEYEIYTQEVARRRALAQS